MKRTKNITNLVIVIILIIITIIVVNKQRKGTIPKRLKYFAVKDTASITRIFLADMKGKSVELIRQDKTWLLNGKYPANTVSVSLLLEAICKIEIKSPVPLSAKDLVIRDLATNGIKIEIYHNKKKIKAYYVGSQTTDDLGTYMALDNRHKEPFIMCIPGFNGYLTPRYFTEEADWKSKVVFNYNPLNIKQVSIEYTDSNEYSFLLEARNDNQFFIKSLDNKSTFSGKIDLSKIKSFLSGFNNIQIVNVISHLSEFKKDSILNLRPVKIITIIDKQNQEKSLKLFYMPSTVRTRIELLPGIEGEYMYAQTTNRITELCVMETLTLERILWKISDFKTKN